MERVAFTIPEAAEQAAISRALLYAEIAAGRGPAVTKIGRRSVVTRTELQRWLESRQRQQAHGANGAVAP